MSEERSDPGQALCAEKSGINGFKFKTQSQNFTKFNPVFWFCVLNLNPLITDFYAHSTCPGFNISSDNVFWVFVPFIWLCVGLCGSVPSVGPLHTNPSRVARLQLRQQSHLSPKVGPQAIELVPRTRIIGLPVSIV